MWLLVITAVLHGHIETYKYANDPRGRYGDYQDCLIDLAVFKAQAKPLKGAKIYLSCELSTY